MIKVQQYKCNLRELIEEHGYTFKDISEETGISLSVLFIYARGERSIPHESRYKIARVIGCSVTDIVSKKQPRQEVSKKFTIDELFPEIGDDLIERTDLVCIQERSLIRSVTTASIVAQKGVNAVLLCEHQRALMFIEESLKIYDKSLLRAYARVLIQKAEACLGLGAIDECTQCAQKAFSLVKDAGSSRTTTRVQALYDRLHQSHWRKEIGVIQLGVTLKENR